jgi:hypothetical protein
LKKKFFLNYRNLCHKTPIIDNQKNGEIIDNR